MDVHNTYSKNGILKTVLLFKNQYLFYFFSFYFLFSVTRRFIVNRFSFFLFYS